MNESDETPQVEETVDISVSVVDENSEAVQGASVILTDYDNEYTGTTGSAGGCTLSNVPLGEYSIIVSAEGYEDYSESLTVTSSTTTLTITLFGEQEIV